MNINGTYGVDQDTFMKVIDYLLYSYYMDSKGYKQPTIKDIADSVRFKHYIKPPELWRFTYKWGQK